MRKRSLILEITLPTVVIVLFGTLVSAHVLGEIFAATHETEADERVRRFGDELEAALARTAGRDHAGFDEVLLASTAASGKQALLAKRDGTVRFASTPGLRESVLALPASERQELERDGQRWVRHVRPVAAAPTCQTCHGESPPIGYLAIDSPRQAAEREVLDQKRTNLAAGFVLAVVLSFGLVTAQLVVLHRPIRRLIRTVDAIRSGDLAARAAVERPDEIGELARTVNEMAESLQHAKAELDRTHRAELAQTEKLASLGQLTSSVAHEIKNPLAGIIGALRVLEGEAAAGGPDKEILGKVLAQAERLSKTAVELLEFARPMQVAVQEADACELLDRAVFFVERQAAAQKVELKRRYTPGLPPVVVDPDLLKQVFLNVVLNGVQAMPKGGTLELQVRAGEGGVVEVAISDQGPGIAPDHLSRIFSPFFSTKAKGTGLGLYVSKQLIDTQRGELRVESHLGQGATFTIRLPTKRIESGSKPAAQESSHG